MCQSYIKLKTKSPSGAKYAYVPCGQCAECRRKQQSDWQFRLNAEFLSLRNQGWHVAFMTLTYSDKTIPVIPKELFKNERDYRPIRCFSRTDVTSFITSLRDYCKYHYHYTGDNALKYFVASEFGSETHRPHYHAILAWPAEGCDYATMHALCTHYWEHGILFPRDVRGDRDMLPFEVVGDASKALTYVSKYVCKDLDWQGELRNVELNTGMRLYKDIQPFHLQSRSLGYTYVKNLTDDQKWSAYLNGVSFQGDGYTYKLPMYVKNKLIFDNDYVVTSSGKRLCRRKASEFFDKHKKEIYKKKAHFYEKMFNESTSAKYYIDRGVEESVAQGFADAIKHYAERLAGSAGFDLVGSGHLGEYYLSYFGVSNDHCEVIHTQDEAVAQWYKRYTLADISSKRQVVGEDEEFVPVKRNVIDHGFWSDLQSYFNLILGANTYCNLVQLYKDAQSDALSRRICDYFNNVLKPML